MSPLSIQSGHMFSKFLKPSTGKSRPGKSAAPAATPDISRVIKQAPVTPESLPAIDPAELAVQAEEAIDSYADQFDTWMKTDLEALCGAWDAAQSPKATPNDYRALYTCAHNIRGAAPSYGYPIVSRLCGSLCALLSRTRPGENAGLISVHVNACRAAVHKAGNYSESEAEAVCDALERKVLGKQIAA